MLKEFKEASSVLSCASSIVTSLMLQVSTLQWFPIKTVMGAMQHAALSFLERDYLNSICMVDSEGSAVGTGLCVCAVFSAAARSAGYPSCDFFP